MYNVHERHTIVNLKREEIVYSVTNMYMCINYHSGTARRLPVAVTWAQFHGSADRKLRIGAFE